jgi:AcrR family transcriptional regulator
VFINNRSFIKRQVVNDHSFIYTGHMAPRPRETTDAAILEATARAMSRVGPARLTLAHVAKDLGIAPATLIQRFGSKRGLLLALSREVNASVGDQFAAIRAEHPSPLAALYAVADCTARMATTPEELANNIAYLHIDLTDPEFHAVTLDQSRATHAEIRTLLEEAVAVGELADLDTDRLAKLIGSLMGGSLLSWAIFRDGTAAERLRSDLDTLLEPYRRPASTGSRSARKQKRGRA